MAVPDLATAAMIIISGAWLDPEKEQPIIECLPLAGPLLGKIKEAHQGLVDYQNAGRQERPEIRELIAQTTALDADHDRYTRGIHSILGGFAEVVENPDTTNRYRSLQSALFPTGLDINKQSYLVQAGEPELREGRLSDDDKKLLEATVVTTPEGPRTLRELVDTLTKIAHALGEAEIKKQRLRKDPGAPSSRGPARQAWARIVSHFLATLDHEDGLSEEDRRRILEPLQTALAKAAQARARAKKKGVAFDPDAEEVVAEGE